RRRGTGPPQCRVDGHGRLSDSTGPRHRRRRCPGLERLRRLPLRRRLSHRQSRRSDQRGTRLVAVLHRRVPPVSRRPTNRSVAAAGGVVATGAPTLIALAVLLALWQLVSVKAVVPPDMLPSPTRI